MLLKRPDTLQKSCISLEARGMRVLGVTTTEEMPTEDKTKKDSFDRNVIRKTIEILIKKINQSIYTQKM